MYRTPPTSRDPSPDRKENTNVVPDNRASRRLQQLPPEHGYLPGKTKKIVAEATPMAAPASPIMLQQPREPPKFRGSTFEDPESWLETYERVATFNSWASDDKLRHVYFALEDAARTWFENREATLTTWDLFRNSFLQTFTSVLRKERAQALLETRAQLPNDTIAIFTEEMGRLFRHADPEMSEEKKVRLLMSGVKGELFGAMTRSPPPTVEEFLREATSIEKTLEMRNRNSTAARTRQTTPELSVATDDLRETIRAVVREELQSIFPSSQPQVAEVAEIVKEEVQRSLGVPEVQPQSSQPQPEAMIYAAVAHRQVPLHDRARTL
ncbi:uncharacterized protein LOC144094125 [Amblyomma americanum]